MAILIDRISNIVSIPQSDCTLIGGTLYELDTDWFWQQLKVIEASEEGMVWPDTQSHNSAYTVAGVNYAAKVEILVPCMIEFTPDSQWTVKLVGTNNNMFDVEGGILLQNQVQVISTNSAGLQLVGGADPAAIAAAVWDAQTADHLIAGSFGQYVKKKLLSTAKFIGLR